MANNFNYSNCFFLILLLQICSIENMFAISENIDNRETIRLQKGINLNTQISKSNCIYEIYDEFCLEEASLQLPDDVVLRFKGGMLTDGTVCGKSTLIDSDGLQIFRHVNLQGTWENQDFFPEWFGATGDGVTDDTEGIRNAMLSAKGANLVFQPKTYIVNVTSGTDNNTQRIIFPNCKCKAFIGNGACIKLGNNDNCNLYKFRGFGALFSIYTIDIFYAKEITFDFNYEQNPIYQTLGIRQDIQENTQLNAFQFRRVRKVVLDNCVFKGHSGTNCIDYNDAKYDGGDKVFEVTIQNCKFLQTGGNSFFYDGRDYVESYHDCSTIAIHYRGSNHNTPLIVNISDNYFEGAGINAYNAIETDASELNFSNNTIVDFASCIYTCSNISNGHISIRNNLFKDVSRGIVLWLRGETDKDLDNYGFQNLDISDNNCYIDINKWAHQPRYDNPRINTSDRYGFLLTTVANNKSINNLSVTGNTIKYTNNSGLTSKIGNKAAISFESASESVLSMRCRKMTVSDNKFYDCVSRVLHNSLFQEIDTLIFDGNYIYHPFSVKPPHRGDGGGVIYLNHSKAYTPSLDYPTITFFEAKDNNIVYDGYSKTDGCAFIVNSQIRGKKKNEGTLIVGNNTCSSIPQYDAVKFLFPKELFKNVYK